MTGSAVQDPCSFLVTAVQKLILLLYCISYELHLSVSSQLSNILFNMRLQDGQISGVKSSRRGVE